MGGTEEMGVGWIGIRTFHVLIALLPAFRPPAIKVVAGGNVERENAKTNYQQKFSHVCPPPSKTESSFNAETPLFMPWHESDARIGVQDRSRNAPFAVELAFIAQFEAVQLALLRIQYDLE